MNSVQDEKIEIEESEEDMSGLIKVLENKQNQINNLENKIKTLEKDHDKLNDKDISDTIDMVDFMSERKSKNFKLNLIKENGKRKNNFDLFPTKKTRKSQFILNKKVPNQEMKSSTLFGSQANFLNGKTVKDSIRSRNSYFPGNKRFESSGSQFITQMSSRIDKLLGRSYQKKNFKKRFGTSGY